MIDILLKYILWYELLNDLDGQRDFDKKKVVTKNLVKPSSRIIPILGMH